MASSKNVQALNNRLDLACRTRIEELYRQHVSRLARLEHQKLDAARLLKSVKKCPSDQEALSIKFLGPAPKAGQRRPNRGPIEDPGNSDQIRAGSKENKQAAQSARPSPTPAELLDDPIVQHQRQQTANPSHTALTDSVDAVAVANLATIERAKTLADFKDQKPLADGKVRTQRRQSRRSRSRRRRARTPFPSKLERFYAQLDGTKQGCGLPVIDATQTAEAHQYRQTLSRSEWRIRLAKLDPEFFKNAHLDSDDSDSSDYDLDAGSTSGSECGRQCRKITTSKHIMS